MILHTETVSPYLLDVLECLMSSDIFKDFRLVGGTCLALQRGHRRSIDIDLFTDLPYGSMPLGQMRDYIESCFPVHENSDALNADYPGYTLYLGNDDTIRIKTDFFYTEPFIFAPIMVGNLRMADERDIAAMKLLAVSGQVKRQKDYWDIHELLESYSLNDMIEWALERYRYTLTKDEIISGLKAIDEVQESPEGIMNLKSLDYWELKVLDLKDIVKNLRK